MAWYRARFLADDARPVKWPPAGPFWCTGYSGDDKEVVVAFVKTKKAIKEFWPEASEVEFTEESDIEFTERFPEPEWWKKKAEAL